MGDNVLALEIITASSEIFRIEKPAKKSAAGCDLARLFFGSVATLGAATDMAERVYLLPEAIYAAIRIFPNIAAADQSTIEPIQLGMLVGRAHLIDADNVSFVNVCS